ncbi:4027_t:CDS:2 [Scutellospora calospora]|uniref:4027_t:CDS:1 n=1 Tax=Scutellospora calospora TaxID=85575 RepID=A0ACA9KKP0_9GLOM|nr:4027_t:CDS:2 [Scutellospora calospora]
MTRYTKLEKKKYEEAAGFENLAKKCDKKKIEKSPEIRVKSSEKRRLRRIKGRLNTTICFGCRQVGHSVRDCPTAKEQGIGICFTCGSAEHTSKSCKKSVKLGDKYKYAKCFVCNEQGHLSGQCPKNEKGLYPNGGACRFCGKVDHFAKDCTLKKEEVGTVVVGKSDLQHGADDDDYHIFINEKKKLKKEEKIERLSKIRKGKIKPKIIKL